MKDEKYFNPARTVSVGTFENSELNYLVLEDYLISKK